jgi:hypothetical protein
MTAKVSATRSLVAAQADNFHSLSDNAKKARTTSAIHFSREAAKRASQNINLRVFASSRENQCPLCLCGKSRDRDAQRAFHI